MAIDLTLPSRDLTGYGATPPNAKWPGGARVAVNFCINYEEGAELCVLNGDSRSESRVSDLVVDARPGGRDLNMESNYEYGSRVSYWRILKAFTGRGLPATVNLVGLAGELVPEPLVAMIEAGFDLQPHGWRWIDYYGMPEAQERALIRQYQADISVKQFSIMVVNGHHHRQAGIPVTRSLAQSRGQHGVDTADTSRAVSQSAQNLKIHLLPENVCHRRVLSNQRSQARISLTGFLQPAG